MANELAHETSPYLRQHQENPVDWHPWGEKALERARAENKPILLSVGYSACHWCHVMAHESFENPAIARVMNENFVNIKVDREERPDLDQVYQNVAMAMTGGGGWPLTVFLTPELKPFFGGTYFPPEDRYGRPGFPRVLEALAKAYREDPAGVRGNADQLMEYIHSVEKVPAAGSQLRPTILELRETAEKFLSRLVDWQNGGVGDAPKFPNPMIFDFLWRFGTATGTESAVQATLLALRKMAQGGIYDQLGGGFHRYAVDATWSVPHFEKMLYDNALLLRLYSIVLLSGEKLDAADRELFTRTVSETVEYLLREMRSPEGAFYSAQDADSEGEEGKFFVWDPEELARLLDANEAKAFALRYGVSAQGNFEHGKTVLYQARTLDEVATELGTEAGQAERWVESARGKLFRAREKRIKPGCDDKILTSWNALLVSGLCWASRALEQEGKPELSQRARKAAGDCFEFLRTRMSTDEGRLLGAFKEGKARFNGYLDDYAFLAMAALDQSRFVSDETAIPELHRQARAWIGIVLEHFKDPAGAGYYFTSDDHEKLVARPKTVMDQAIPAGTSVLLSCLAALAEIDPDAKSPGLEAELESQLTALFPAARANPFGYGELLCASMLDSLGPVVVSGTGSESLIRHPHVFRKAADPDAPAGKVLICHQRACGLPLSLENAAAELGKKVRV